MHPDGCTSTFQYELLQKALPSKVMQKYDELQATRAMEIARVEGLHRCPRCDFQALLDASEMIFACPVQSCRFESCKLCGEASHIPLKCSEVEKQTETDGRKKVEEAMSEARIRTCPKEGCGNRFYKVDGCNKMTCPKCRTFSCYICRALIPKNVGYQHFCQTAHCQHHSCNKCPLYTNNKEDDIRATKEAGEKAAKEIAESTAQGVNVDVDALQKMLTRHRLAGVDILRCRLHLLPHHHRQLRPQRPGSTPGFHLVQQPPRHIIHRAFRRRCWSPSSCILSHGRHGWASSWNGWRRGR